MYKNVVLAYDGSDHALRAAEQVIQIAKSPDAEVKIVYVVNDESSKSDAIRHLNGMDLNEKRRVKLQPIEAKITSNGIRTEVVILHGEPGTTIVNYVNNNQTDLVVIGSRGLNSLQELVLGSVSHKVAKRANCPVLIVK